MNRKYSVSLKQQWNVKKLDDEKELFIKPAVPDTHHPDIRLRKDRFSIPIPVSILTMNNRTVHLATHDGRDFVTAYMKYAAYKFLTTVDIVEEAAVGIIEEGAKLGKRDEAERLAEKLRSVKHFAANLKSMTKIPSEIGQACVYLYTMETFWYKLINSLLGNPPMINETHVQTLGPFCYLLKTYLRANSTRNIFTVYRGVHLTDQQIQKYRTTKECFNFTAFTSTSTNRTSAEL